MSKKHFEALADGLAEIRPPKSSRAQYAVWLDAVKVMADVCDKTNPLFDRRRFIQACEERVKA